MAEAVRDRLTQTPRTLCVSGLVRLECIAGPLRSGDVELLHRYRRIFAEFQVVPIIELAFDLAAEIRAASGLRLPDALHLAIAETNACDEVWTADADFGRAAGAVTTHIRRIA